MYEAIITKYSTQYSVPAPIINAVIATESSWEPLAYRWEDALNEASYGLMQLLTSTARDLGYTGSPEGLYDPDTNIHYGTKLLANIIEVTGMVPERIYSMYNSGKADRYLTSSQVAEHVKRFMANLGNVVMNGSTPAVFWAVLFLLWAYFKKGK